MNPTTTATASDSQTDLVLVLQRTMDPLQEFSSLVLFLPVLFAFVVLFLVLFFRQQEPLSSLLKTLFVPRLVVGLSGLAWAAYLLVFLAFCFGTLGYKLYGDKDFAIDSLVYVLWGLPLVLYPLLLGILALVVLCLRRPMYVIPVAAVTFVSAVYLVFGWLFKPLLSWWVILVPLLALALVYVALMYKRDAQSINPFWAAFLGLLRCTVYAVLVVVFLLPGCQTYNTHEVQNKVLVLFDVTGSMDNIDDVVGPGQKAKDLPSRQDKVLSFLDKKYVADDDKNLNWLQHVVLKSPVSVYRFGAVLDDFEVPQFLKDAQWDEDERKAWFHPNLKKLKVPTVVNGQRLDADQRQKLGFKLVDMYKDLRSGTNISGTAREALERESANKIQAIIIVSDGKNNTGTTETTKALYQLAADPKAPIHIMTVGVGYHRPPVGIRVDDVNAPAQARPDDKFPVQVRVFGDGLRGREFTVNLDVVRVIKDKETDKWKPVEGTAKRLTKTGKFKEGKERPFDTVEFQVIPRELAGLNPKDDTKDAKVIGDWEFKAWVDRNPEERTTEDKHESKHPAYVRVQKRSLRILLFAGGPSREYQFVRTLLFREVQDKRVEMCVYLQSGQDSDVDQDVPPERLLTHFPDQAAKTNIKDQKFYSLTEYDVIIAFDPDWNELDTNQLKLLKNWVSGPSMGGFIFVAGPINSYQPARPGGRDLSALQTILPVKLKDSRLHGLGLGHDSTRPYALHFPKNAGQFDFMNLTENAKDPLEGWKKFFWDGEEPPPGKEGEPVRGIYTYYPVSEIQPAAQVLATFAGPPKTYMKGSSDSDAEEMPFLVTMPYGKGKTVFVGSGELWNLRSYDHEFHQRFWMKLCRFVGSGNLDKVNNYGFFLVPPEAKTGQVDVRAQLLGENLRPLPPGARPEVKVVLPKDFDRKADKNTADKFSLEPKGTTDQDEEWQGWFSGQFKVFTPGRYTLKIAVPGTGEELSADITIKQPNPEQDDTKPDFAYLRQMATSAQPILKRLNAQKQRELTAILERAEEEANKSDKADKADKANKAGKDKKAKVPQSEDTGRHRLFFTLDEAKIIPDLLLHYPRKFDSSKGAYLDLWDRGWGAESLSIYYVLTWIPGCVGLLLTVLLLVNRQWLTAAILAAVAVLFVTTVVLVGLIFPDMEWARISLETSAYYVVLFVPSAIALFTVAILLTLKRWVFAAALIGVTALYAVGVLVSGLFVDNWLPLQLHMSHVLLVVVGLLALEWLTRKLLRLA